MGFGIKDLKAEDELTREQWVRFGRIFAAADKDQSGAIDIKELHDIFRKCGIEFSADGIALVMQFAAIDGSQTIHEKEFRYFLGRVLKQKALFEKNAVDGLLDINGVNETLKALGYKFAGSQVQTLFRLLDRDASGTFDLAEFLQMGVFLRFCKLQFILADTDGSGEISFGEIAAHLEPLGLVNIPDAMLRQVFEQIDVSKDGQLQFEEFATLVCKIKVRKAKKQ